MRSCSERAIACVEAQTDSCTTWDGKTTRFGRDDLDPDREWQRLRNLVAHYFRPDQGYPARRALFKAEQVGDYDHLARYGEWEMSDTPVPEDLE